MKSDDKKKFDIKEYFKSVTDVHFLMGCRFDVYLKLLKENKISPKRIPRILYIGAISLAFYPFALAEEVFCKLFVYPFTKLKTPLFVLGHWRSGTTYLFELLGEDPQFVYLNPASTYTVNNYLFMRKAIDKFQGNNIGNGRPMDNMDYTIESPSEETFSISAMSTKSCMNMVVFPQNYRYYADYMFTNDMTMEERMEWEKNYKHILQKAVYEDGRDRKVKKASDLKRLILKSPDNTARIEEILHLFPNARFVNIVRNPYKVEKSTMGMIDQCIGMMSFQDIPDREDIMDYVVDMYADVYHRYLNERSMIPEGHLIEIKYEDFVKKPYEHLEKIYKTLGIKGFAKAAPNFKKHIEGVKDYQVTKSEIEPLLKKKVNEKLGFAFEAFGYEMEDVEE